MSQTDFFVQVRFECYEDYSLLMDLPSISMLALIFWVRSSFSLFTVKVSSPRLFDRIRFFLFGLQ